MKKTILIVGLFSAFSAFAGNLSFQNKVEGTGYVYRVIDGDTYDINIDSNAVYNDLKSKSNKKERKYLKDKYKNFRVRLANTNTAESKHPDASRNTSEGKTASNYVKNLIEGKKVRFVCWDHGKYGRAICSVSYGGQDVGLNLIQNNYSTYVTRYGKHPYLHNQYSN